jgi:hypothetical protein
LVLRSAEGNWRTSPFAEAQLFEAKTLVWAIKLPQIYGPRYAFVNDRGEVLLLDEWMARPGPYCIMTVGLDGKFRAQSFQDVQREIGIAANVLAHSGHDSSWLSGPPSLDASGDTASAEAAGVKIVIDLKDGRLTKLHP